MNSCCSSCRIGISLASFRAKRLDFLHCVEEGRAVRKRMGDIQLLAERSSEIMLMSVRE